MGEITHTQSAVRRRTVLKGAAWSVPIVAAAAAVPAQASSASDCPCFVPSRLGSGANFGANQISGNKGVITYNSGFGIDATACTHTALTYQVTVIGATLSMSTGQSISGAIVAGGVTNNDFASPHGAVPANFEFSGVDFPDGNYSSIGATPAAQPSSMTVRVRLDWDGLSCEKDLNYQFTLGNVGNFSSGQVSGGTAVLGVAWQMTMVGL